MVFWITYPVKNIIHRLFNRSKFTSLIFDRPDIFNRPDIKTIILKYRQNKELLYETQLFIKNNFGSPPKTPILNIPVNYLLTENDIMIIAMNDVKEIIGCIRYHYIGMFISSHNQPIYCVDCFCIRHDWRKKGIGDYLLSVLHEYTNKNNIPYCVFLKEGSILNIVHMPIYSGIYVYKSLNTIINNPCKTNRIHNERHVNKIDIDIAYKLIDIYIKMNPEIFVIRNYTSKNQEWFIYKNDIYNILCCIQDTYQVFKEEGKEGKENNTIGWCTGWFESPNVCDSMREHAINAILDYMQNEYTECRKFGYIWMNKKWIGNSKHWNTDGSFHWYLYQWNTSININYSYCILN